MKTILTISFAIATISCADAQNTYSLDKNHSRLSFSAMHLGISHVEGIFKVFDASFISSKEDFSEAKIEMTAQAASLTTEVEMRDKDLRDNWFEVTKYPTIHFKSSSFARVKGTHYKLSGDITIRGVTKPITFDVIFNGKGQSPFTKKYSYGFTVTGKLNRKDFGMDPEKIQTVSDEVEVRANVEFLIN